MKLLTIIILGLSLLPVSSPADEPEVDVLYSAMKLTPEAAQLIANGAMADCRSKGAQISVVVLDGGGHIQVLLRDRLAGFSTPEGAILKAKTAINFRGPTLLFTEAVRNDPGAAGIEHLPGVLLLGGGLPIETSGSLVGAVGVAGAPNGEMDEHCAQAGIDAVQDELEFAD